MKHCKAACLHRALVEEFRIARHAQMLEEEALTVGDPWMIADRRAAGIRPVTFKEWLTGSARARDAGSITTLARLTISDPTPTLFPEAGVGFFYYAPGIYGPDAGSARIADTRACSAGLIRFTM